MTLSDKNGDPILDGVLLTWPRGEQGRFWRFIDSAPDENLEQFPENGRVEVDVDGLIRTFPTFASPGGAWCPDVEVVPEALVEVLERFGNGHPSKVSVRDSRSPVAIVALRIGGSWEPLHGRLSDGTVRELPACFHLGERSLRALDGAS